ncbi:MAG TPA: hypothetical protein ENF82_03565 [Candidatus Methanomethylia archaeon]|nr:hypothetical protein [Candidatus Methanomethylicia archaeon]
MSIAYIGRASTLIYAAWMVMRMGKVRYVCLKCQSKKGGGFFSVEAGVKTVKCPYCGSRKVRRLG